MITLKEIAQHCDVTVQTVSCILNRKGTGMYNKQTVEKVVTVAKSLGYRPNSAAQATRRGRHDCIMLLMSSIKGKRYLPADLLDGIHDELAAKGQRLVLGYFDDEALESHELFPEVLRRWMSDGLIINYAHFIPPLLRDLIDQYDIPAIWVNVKQKEDAVYPDDY